MEELTRGVKVRTDIPHLISLGGGRLSTAVTIFPLEPGEIVPLISHPQISKPRECLTHDFGSQGITFATSSGQRIDGVMKRI